MAEFIRLKVEFDVSRSSSFATKRLSSSDILTHVTTENNAEKFLSTAKVSGTAINVTEWSEIIYFVIKNNDANETISLVARATGNAVTSVMEIPPGSFGVIPGLNVTFSPTITSLGSSDIQADIFIAGTIS